MVSMAVLSASVAAVREPSSVAVAGANRPARASDVTSATGPIEDHSCKVTSGTTAVSGGPEVPGVMAPDPTGVVAAHIYSGSRKPVFASAVYSDKLISGVDVLAQWCNLEPQPGVYNWTPLTQIFDQADASGKFVILTLIPGLESPSWALANAKWTTSSFQYGGSVPARSLPMPWDQTYLTNWFAFLQAVADQYGTNPAFRVIETAGPTSVSTEMSEPNWTGTTASANDYDHGLPNRYHGSDLAMWKAMGYTPARYVAAWRETFGEYRKIFPNQHMALSLVNGLPIGPGGKFDGYEVTATPLDVIAAALAHRGAIIQTDGVSPDSPSQPPYAYVQASCGRAAATGFQTGLPGEVGTLTAADLAPAWEAGADFVEVYEENVLTSLKSGATAATERNAIVTAHSMLPASKTCAVPHAPLELSGSPLTATPSDAAVGWTLLTELNWNDAKFDPPFETLTFTAVINIYDGQRLIAECYPGSTCTVPIAPGPVRTSITADIGAPGTIPYTNQAVASAKAVINAAGTPPKAVPPDCKPTACL